MSAPVFAIPQSSSDRLAVLDRLIKAHAERYPGFTELLEIGSYEGSSALSFSESIGRHSRDGGSILCVDRWEPYLPADDVAGNDVCRRMEDDLAAGKVFERFQNNIRFANPWAKIDFRKGTFESVVKNNLIDLNRRFDIIYIDASHIYTDVIKDIMLAIPFLKFGGLLCGDDLEVQLHAADRRHVIDHANREYVGGYHPGVTLAVGEKFGPVWSESGAWAVRKMDDSGTQWGQPW